LRERCRATRRQGQETSQRSKRRGERCQDWESMRSGSERGRASVKSERSARRGRDRKRQQTHGGGRQGLHALIQLAHTIRRASFPRPSLPELLGLVEAHGDDPPARPSRLSIHRLKSSGCLLRQTVRDEAKLLRATLGVGHDLGADDAAKALEEEEEVLRGDGGVEALDKEVGYGDD
jgi:hypothetical protein